MAGKKSWPSVKPDFCCCPSVFGEGEGGKQWFIANSFENCCEQEIMEGSNLISERSFAHFESAAWLQPSVAPVLAGGSDRLGRRHVSRLCVPDAGLCPGASACTASPFARVPQTGDRLPAFPSVRSPRAGCGFGKRLGFCLSSPQGSEFLRCRCRELL